MFQDDEFMVEEKSSFEDQIIYNAFKNDRTVYIYGEINEAKELVVNRMLEKLALKSLEPIKIIVSSVGGDFYAGASIVSTIESLKLAGIEVNTYTAGKTISMGVPISISGTNRYIQRYSSFMLHNVAIFMPGYVSGEQLRRGSRDANKIRDVYRGIILSNTKMTEEHFNDIFEQK
jgi:ATP-dependent protease ClpP protease subunit